MGLTLYKNGSSPRAGGFPQKELPISSQSHISNHTYLGDERARDTMPRSHETWAVLLLCFVLQSFLKLRRLCCIMCFMNVIVDPNAR